MDTSTCYTVFPLHSHTQSPYLNQIKETCFDDVIMYE